MPNLFTVAAHAPIARITARHVMDSAAGSLANTLILLPNRRSCAVMRRAFQSELAGKAALLPRMVALADIDSLVVSVLGARAFDVLATIPPAFTDAQHRYLLARQVAAYERKRMGAVTMHYALTMADALMQLQETCMRAGVEMTQEKLRQLYHADFADHWREAFLFLGILTDSWPAIERAYGLATAASREVKLLDALAAHWVKNQPDFAVIAVGSTASQPATARLLKTIADLPNGQVILPALDATMDDEEWNAIRAGHPLHHLKEFLAQWPVTRAKVKPLAAAQPNLWLEALAPSETMLAWKQRPLPAYQSLRIIPCAQSEQEVRVICLLLREALETPTAHAALITPDEGLMARVANHMQRYNITVDRLSAGTLAATQTGSLWLALVAAITDPSRQLTMRELLHHPLLAIDADLLKGLERGWYGLNRSRAGQLPRHDESLATHADYAKLNAWVERVALLTKQSLPPLTWLSTCAALIGQWQQTSGQGAEAVAEQLAALADADDFGPMAIEDFSALLAERFSTKWRDAGLNAHPRLHMLTPVEARLQTFDRVILANMQEQHWPGGAEVNPWLNLAAQKTLGLPSPEEGISLMAHDVLMLASHGEIFLTYPLRDAGSPSTRSRFIERLVTLLKVHGTQESAITASHYVAWAEKLYASDVFAPEPAVWPLPSAYERPCKISVTSLDTLFSDPFSIYARYVLGLRALDAMDADPEASDFGSLTHRAIEQLTQHWNETNTAASDEQLADIAQRALRALAERPNIDLFWRTRLMNGLRYINRLEATRRSVPMQVACERKVESIFVLGDTQLTLEGRIDRVEPTANGAVIVDYKTGEIPSIKAILEGRALQMLAYAMLLENEGEGVAALEYWQLPKLGEEGKTLPIPMSDIPGDLPEKLRAALADMLNPATPFLARPVATSGDERFGNDYDGISRYDEWAG